jgi:hypothetical protein
MTKELISVEQLSSPDAGRFIDQIDPVTRKKTPGDHN